MCSVTFATARLRRVKEKEPTKSKKTEKNRREKTPVAECIGIESQATTAILSILRLPGCRFLSYRDLNLLFSTLWQRLALFLNLSRDLCSAEFNSPQHTRKSSPERTGKRWAGEGRENALLQMHIRSPNLTALSVETLSTNLLLSVKHEIFSLISLFV